MTISSLATDIDDDLRVCFKVIDQTEDGHHESKQDVYDCFKELVKLMQKSGGVDPEKIID